VEEFTAETTYEVTRQVLNLDGVFASSTKPVDSKLHSGCRAICGLRVQDHMRIPGAGPYVDYGCRVICGFPERGHMWIPEAGSYSGCRVIFRVQGHMWVPGAGSHAVPRCGVICDFRVHGHIRGAGSYVDCGCRVICGYRTMPLLMRCTSPPQPYRYTPGNGTGLEPFGNSMFDLPLGSSGGACSWHLID
jgi:hypothetical protein